MDAKALKEAVSAGNVGVDQLLEIIAHQADQIAQLKEQFEQLKEQLAAKNSARRLNEAYSEKAEEKRQAKRKRQKKKRRKPIRRGRLFTADKIKLAQRTEQVYSGEIAAEQCKFSHTRVAWRLEEGRAVLIAYDIYRHHNRFSKPPGLLSSSAPQGHQAKAAIARRTAVPRVRRRLAGPVSSGQANRGGWPL